MENVTPTPSSTPSKTKPTWADRLRPWGAVLSILSAAVITATLLTFWTPANLFANQMLERMFLAVQPGQVLPQATPTNPPRPRIGIVSGHWGYDSGAVCADGLTEEEVNQRIATLVKQQLMNEGYDVDLLEEKDIRLNQYRAAALVSIHNDSCDFINNEATGFKVAAALANKHPEKSARLTSCLVQRYNASTQLPFHYNTITDDMTGYHAFDEIDPQTPAAIIETGFLNLDREILTKQPDLVARGVTNGILCFLRNEDIPPVSATLTPTP